MLVKDRVYYVSEALVRQGASVERKRMLSLGTCMGKFTHTGKFRLHITALPLVAPFAPYKVHLKESSELGFMYKNHVYKSGLASMTENTPQYQGVVVYSSQDQPIGFGVAAKSTAEASRLPGTEIVVFHQADIGEYLRDEASLV
jgi:60S ribosome subunit biogenesis protein NIP7